MNKTTQAVTLQDRMDDFAFVVVPEVPAVPTAEQVMDRFYDIVACNGSWADFSSEIGTRALIYEVDLDDLSPFADYLYEGEEWEGCDREAFDEVLLDAFNDYKIEPGLVDSFLLSQVYNTSGLDLDEFVSLAVEAGVSEEAIDGLMESENA